jgi:hypothetical protein
VLIEKPFKFVFQFLKERATLRRGRVQFESINEPFSSERFHFGKINKSEILFEFKNDSEENNGAKTVAIVNVSPIEWGHFLLVPELENNLAQRLNATAVRKAIEMMKLTKDKYFRVSENSFKNTKLSI